MAEANAFERFQPATVRMSLRRNFRSRAEITSVAARAIAANHDGRPVALIAVRGAGGSVRSRAFTDDAAEANCTAAMIRAELDAGTDPREILCVARLAHTLAPLAEHLASVGVPHRILGALALYRRAEARRALALLRLLANPRDLIALRLVLRLLPGIGSSGAANLAAAIAGAGVDCLHGLEQPGILAVLRTEEARRAAHTLGGQLRVLRDQAQAGRPVGHLVLDAVMLPGGLVAQLQRRLQQGTSRETRHDAARGLEDLRGVCRTARQFSETQPGGTLGEFLERVGLEADPDKEGPDTRVTLATLHRAKGTEADVVFLIGAEEGTLPCFRALDDPSPEAIGEERRCFYVALTRARERLLITVAGSRRTASGRQRPTGGPSRFLAEAGIQLEHGSNPRSD